MSRRVLALFAGAVLSSGLAHAATITDLITFTAASSSQAAPSYSGSFLLTFDPATVQESVDVTSGITVASFSHTFSTPVTPAYDFVTGGGLQIGGLLNTVAGIFSSTNDYLLNLDFYGQNIQPVFGSFVITDAASSSRSTFGFGTATLTQVTTPEPSSFVLLGSGLLGMVGIARRRRA